MSIENKAKAWKMVINMIISILTAIATTLDGMRAGIFYILVVLQGYLIKVTVVGHHHDTILLMG